MGLKTKVATLAERIRNLLDQLSFLAPLATRIVIGLAFIHTGLGKWRFFERTVGYFDSLGIPFPTFNAALVASLELVGGAFLVAGLLTRFMASGLATTMIVALATADTQAFLSSWKSSSEISPTDVTSFTFLLFLSWLILKGPGALSLDALLARFLGIDRARGKAREVAALEA